MVKRSFEVEHSEEYRKVIRSPRWRKIRKERLWSAGWRCEACGCAGTEKTLELHHLNYERLGDEHPNDLQLLCQSCHFKADQERAARTRQKNAASLYWARLDGWASKVYGDDWELYEDIDRVEARFDRWLDSIGEC